MISNNLFHIFAKNIAMKFIPLLGWLIATIAIGFIVIQNSCKKEEPAPEPVIVSGFDSKLLEDANAKVVELTGQVEELTAKNAELPKVRVKHEIQIHTETVTDSASLQALREQYEAQMQVYADNTEYYEQAIANLDSISRFPAESVIEIPQINYSNEEKGKGYTMKYEISSTGTIDRFKYWVTLDKQTKNNFIALSAEPLYNFDTKEFILPVELTYGHKWWTISAGRALNQNTYTAGAGVVVKF